MCSYYIQRIFLEDIEKERDIEDIRYNGPRELEGNFLFTEPFPWWSEEQAMPFYDTFNQNLFWQELKVSNWHEFDHQRGMKGYVEFVPLILKHVLDLYQKNGYMFISHAQGYSLYYGYNLETKRPKGPEITLIFSKQE